MLIRDNILHIIAVICISIFIYYTTTYDLTRVQECFVENLRSVKIEKGSECHYISLYYYNGGINASIISEEEYLNYQIGQTSYHKEYLPWYSVAIIAIGICVTILYVLGTIMSIIVYGIKSFIYTDDSEICLNIDGTLFNYYYKLRCISYDQNSDTTYILLGNKYILHTEENDQTKGNIALPYYILRKILTPWKLDRWEGTPAEKREKTLNKVLR